MLAILGASYTAFLFAQAKARDLWQNPYTNAFHMLIHAMLAGSTIILYINEETINLLTNIILIFVCLNFIFVVVILATTGFGSIAAEQKTKLLDPGWTFKGFFGKKKQQIEQRVVRLQDGVEFPVNASGKKMLICLLVLIKYLIILGLL